MSADPHRITMARSSKVFVLFSPQSPEQPTVLINTEYIVEWRVDGPQVFKPFQAESPAGETQESPWCSG